MLIYVGFLRRLFRERNGKPPNLQNITNSSLAKLPLQSRLFSKTASSILNHYNAGFTLRIYTLTMRQKQDDIVQMMGGLIVPAI